jgi:hypothetical protein
MIETQNLEPGPRLPDDASGRTSLNSFAVVVQLIAVLHRLETTLASFDARAVGLAVQAPPGDEISRTGTLWDVDEVAEFLHRSRRWVYGAIASPRMGLPFFRLPGRGGPRFDPAAVRKWLETRCTPHESRRRRVG